jgi:hypothetical protein
VRSRENARAASARVGSVEIPEAGEGGVTTASEFGPFSVMFEPGGLDVPAYLELLNLSHRDGAVAALRRLRAVLDASEWSEAHLEALLGGLNWRPHLVGAVASLMLEYSHKKVPWLWRTLDKGSWVAPQICTALSFVQPSFVETARTRILALNEPRPNCKVIASLLGLLRLEPAHLELVVEAEGRPDVRELLERDRALDNSDRIVERWRGGLLALARMEPGRLRGLRAAVPPPAQT